MKFIIECLVPTVLILALLFLGPMMIAKAQCESEKPAQVASTVRS